MTNWMLRGVVYAAAMVVVRLIQGALINAWQRNAGLFSVSLLLLFIIAVAVWGVLDGRADAKAHRDPDRRGDLAMTWLLAGLLAGLLSGAVCWLIALVYQGLYTGGVLNELTTFAAFTALCVFLPGIIGVTIGRWRGDRNPPPPRGGGGDEERADTDVFAAVRSDDAPTGGVATGAAAEHEERTGSVATAERGAYNEGKTESLPTGRWGAPTESAAHEREAPTESIPTADDAPKNEVSRTGEEHTKPEPKKD